jgi:ABC-type maltose transport system permease subunit
MADQIKAAASILAAGAPWLERVFRVFPVTDAVRDAALPAAVLASLLCVIAGYATSRHSYHGLAVGWTALMLFMAVVVALFGFMDLIPRGQHGMYISCFALFGLSVSSFLSLKPYVEEVPSAPATRW